MRVKWKDINQGDFFFIEFADEGSLLYQKIDEKNGYNAVLLNSGKLCQIYTSPDSKQLFEKVTVTFNIHNISDNE